jgi:hypothetical protein
MRKMGEWQVVNRMTGTAPVQRSAGPNRVTRLLSYFLVLDFLPCSKSGRETSVPGTSVRM